MEVIQDDYMKVYTPLGATALILVDFSYIGQSTADSFPASLIGCLWNRISKNGFVDKTNEVYLAQGFRVQYLNKSKPSFLSIKNHFPGCRIDFALKILC